MQNQHRRNADQIRNIHLPLNIKRKKQPALRKKSQLAKSARQIMNLEKQWEKSTRRLIRQAEKSTKHQLKFLSRLSGIWMILGYLCLTIWEKRERN